MPSFTAQFKLPTCSLNSVTEMAKRIFHRKRLTGCLWQIVRVGLPTYVLIILIMMFIETWLVYPMPPRHRGDWEPSQLEREDILFESADGTRLFGWYVPHQNPRYGLVYCHGNGEHVADNAKVVASLRDELQASVFIFDYRGYGKSEGRPYEAGVVADGEAAQKWLADRMELETDQIVMMGRSLGGAVAVASASKLGARALVVESSFARMTDTAQQLYPWLPVRFVMRNRYDSIARIGQYDGPLFQSHGTNDEIIPITHGRELFQAAPTEAKKFLELHGLGHNNVPPPTYRAQIAKFLDEHSGN